MMRYDNMGKSDGGAMKGEDKSGKGDGSGMKVDGGGMKREGSSKEGEIGFWGNLEEKELTTEARRHRGAQVWLARMALLRLEPVGESLR